MFIVAAICAFLNGAVPAQLAPPPISIAKDFWHLGNSNVAEWTEAPPEPTPAPLELEFDAESLDSEGTLLWYQRDVDDLWHIEINGRRITTLQRKNAAQQTFCSIPGGVLVDGVNRFRLSCETTTDDIVFGDIRYARVDVRTHLKLQKVRISLRDPAGIPLPGRVTVTGPSDQLAHIYFGERESAAVREGVIYTSNGVADFELKKGEYIVHAARGTEWSFAHAPLVVGDTASQVELELRRELDTTGFIAADTHIHTLTHSGHGDSTVEERMVTLAGEGVELAIATDHNHNTDYRPTQTRMGLTPYFTPVVGNEVTTPIGHLNAFPLDPNDDIPQYDLHDIVKIVEGIRSKGAIAIILNHPRWPDHDTGPHGTIELDPDTGDWTGSWACRFDALEVINSMTEEQTPRLLFEDWFALLNRGERVFAVASSDSHTVGGVVGQGRTYVVSSTDDPAKIDVAAAAHNIANGHSSVSMGLFVDVRRNGESALGRTLPQGAFQLRIAAPSWATPRRVTVFANGIPVFEQTLSATQSAQDFRVSIGTDLPWPEHDYWMVALVEGDGVDGAWWPQLNDYTLAATNPVFVDRSGDGNWSSARKIAQEWVGRMKIEPDDVDAILQQVDSAVAVQILRLLQLAYADDAEARIEAIVRRARARHPNLERWLNRKASKDR